MSEPPYDEFEGDVYDEKIEDLRKNLAPLRLSSESFEILHDWIHSTAVTRAMEHDLDNAAHVLRLQVTTSEQVEECKQMAHAASVLAKHFEPLRSSGQTMRELSATYQELFSEHVDAPVVIWRTFAKRVLSEAMLLERVASETSQRLQLKKLRTGAPPKTDRNMLLAEWFDLLKGHTGIEREEIYTPAMLAWNAYFRSKDKVNSAEQLKKALAAGRAKRRKKALFRLGIDDLLSGS